VANFPIMLEIIDLPQLSIKIGKTLS
jgi:hypothetical protein